jgi:hypothetical protein
MPGVETVFDGECGVCGREAVLRMVTGLCENAGVTCADAAAIGWVSSENSIILIPGARLVARVARLRFLPRLRRELMTAALLDDVGIPVALPAVAPPSGQLTVIGDQVITWWRYVAGQRTDWLQVASAIRRLHEIPVPPGALRWLGRLDPTAKLRRCARIPSALPEPDRAAYQRYVVDLAERWSASSMAREPGVLLHGDAHRDNAIAADGAVVLLDFEDAAIGPRLYDLRAPFALQRFGYCTAAEIEAFLDAYGRPVPGGDTELLADLKVAEMCGMYVALCADYPHVIEQTRLRIASLTDRSLYAEWWTEWHEPEQ